MKYSSIFRVSWLAFLTFTYIVCLFNSPLHAEETKAKKVSEKGYTINFENVSIQEFVRFVSKIAGMNIIYDEEDLNFNVTIFSEEETSVENVVSALVQVLRIRGLSLLEEGQNLLIHKNPSVRQIPTVVAGSESIDQEDLPPIVTKVFKIRKGNPSQIASLITPMLSTQAMVEVSVETRQLIITDTLSSIRTIGQLLLSLDASDIPYDIESYITQTLTPLELSKIVAEIMTPLSDNTMLKLVPRDDTHTIYIVSTPFLVDKTLSVLREVDRSPLTLPSGKTSSFSEENIYVYHTPIKNVEHVKELLGKLVSDAREQGFASGALSSTIETMKYVPSMHALVFVGPPKDLKLIRAFLEGLHKKGFPAAEASSFFLYEPKSLSPQKLLKMLDELKGYLREDHYQNGGLIHILDTAKEVDSLGALLFTGSAKEIADLKELLTSIENSHEAKLSRQGPVRFFIYNIRSANEEQIRESLHNLADYLEHNDYSNANLIDAIDSMKWIKSSNSLIFTGHPAALDELRQLLPTFDIGPEKSLTPLSQTPPSSDFLIFTPKSVSAERMEQMIKDTAQNLIAANLADPTFLKTLESVKAIPSSNQLIFTGDKNSLARLHTLLTDLDQNENLHPNPSRQSFPVPLKYVDYQTMKEALDHYAHDLPSEDPVKQMIADMQWIPQSHLLLFHGSPKAMKKISEIIALTDTPENASTDRSNFELIRVEKGDGRDILQQLKTTARQLKRSGTASQSLINALESAEWVPGSNNILVVGSERDIARVKALITNYDAAKIPADQKEVFVYRLKYISYKELQSALRGIAEHADAQDSIGAVGRLSQAIETMREIPDSDAVQFVGDPTTIAKIQELLTILDTPDHARISGVQKGLGSNFLVYRVKNLPPKELIAHLQSIATESLTAKEAADSALIRSINTVRYVEGSNALVFTGNKVDLDKIHALLERLDVSEGPSAPAVDRKAESYQLYTPKYVPGNELIQMIRNFQDHLVSSGVSDPDTAEVIAHLTYVSRTNTIILTGIPSSIDRVMDLLKRFDNPDAVAPEPSDIATIKDTGFLLYKVQNISGNQLVSALRSIGRDVGRSKGTSKNEALVDAISSVQWIEATNSLLATGEDSVLKSVKQLMQSLDRPLKQVFIEILVLESTTSSELDFGLNWQSQGRVHDRFSWGTGNYAPSSNNPAIPFAKNLTSITGSRTPQGQDIPPLPGGFLGIIGDLIFHKGKTYASLGSLLNALKADGTTTIVLSQKIVVQDNQNAKIFSGDNVPFTGSLVTTSGLSQTTNANLEYRNIGVTVNLTPIIGDNGIITMDLNEEISEEVNTGQSSSNNINLTTINGIRTSKTSMQTRVHVPDKAFLILTGTMRNQVVRKVAGIPCLGGLPFIGAAFSETQKATQNRNVVIFVKPHIIQTDEVYAEITQNQEELYGSPEQSNTEDFDRGLELVKTPDDAQFDTDEFEN